MSASQQPPEPGPTAAEGAASATKPPAPPSFWARLMKFWKLLRGMLSKQTLLLIIAVAVVLFTWATQGFTRAVEQGERSRVPAAQLGDTLESGPFEITFTQIRPHADCAFAPPDFPECLEVDLQLLNTTDSFVEDPIFGTHLIDAGLVTLRAPGGTVPTSARHPQVESVRTGEVPPAPQPGLVQDLRLRWFLPAGTQFCDLELTLAKAQWQLSPMDLHEHWVRAEAAKVIPLCARPEPATGEGS